MFGWLRKSSPVPEPGAAAWRDRGNAALAQGQLLQAADCYRAAAAADPADAAARVNLGYVLLEQADFPGAIATLAQAVALAQGRADPLADAQFLLGRAHRMAGSVDAAAAALRGALSARPGFAEAQEELVSLLLSAGRGEEAVEAARQLVALAPSPPAWMQLAQALHAAGRPQEALEPLRALLGAQPDDLGGLECLGSMQLASGRAQEALATFERLLRVHGARPDSLANASAALLRLDRPAEALALADDALRLQPGHREALHNKICALTELLRVDEALALASEGASRYPGDPDFEWDLAVARLLRGEYEQGWRLHESRWRAEGFALHSVRPSAQPQWTGEASLRDRSILLFAEQGLGDSIQFLRYVPRVAALAGQVFLRLPAALVPLVGEPAANCRIVREDEAVPPHDFQCPLLSLPCAFGTTLADVPAPIPYLRVDGGRRSRWLERLAAGDGLAVGIVWSGNPRHRNDRRRSIPLAEFRAIDPGGVRFVSLQPQVRDTDRRGLADWPGLVDAGPQLGDYADTAAAVERLDLVVSVDTSVAHLAGALGKPIWILLPYLPDWRWLLEREDSPWYPTARLYRQRTPGDWVEVLARVKEDLAALAPSR
ncbi:MAG: tetratricopeptide repeat protein [Burkholderiales bacterium]|nr:tetratricopeptide repeat protein [Burkholderiales bacterium]